MPDQLEPSATTRDRLAFYGKQVRQHPGLTLWWAVTFALLTYGTVAGSWRVGQWALWLALIALLVTVARISRWVVQRFVRIVSVFVDDVDVDTPRHRGKVARFPTRPPHGGNRRSNGG